VGVSLMSRLWTSVARLSSATLRTAICSSFLFSDAKGDTGRTLTDDACDRFEELDDSAV